MNKHAPWAWLLACLLHHLSASAGEPAYLTSQYASHNPFVQIHGLSGFSGSRVAGAGRLSARFQVDVSNEFFRRSRAREQIVLDYERTRLSVDLQYGVAKGLSVGIEAPFWFNSGGILDSLIEGWHDTFDLPQGGRDSAPRDLFRIAYQGREDSFVLDHKGRGIGDISAFIDKQLIDRPGGALKARLALKLPTGDERQLFGSGGMTVSMAVNGSTGIADGWRAFGALGLNFLEKGKVLANRQNRFVATATAGIEWRFGEKFGLSAQLDANSKVYDDGVLAPISGKAGILGATLSYRYTNAAMLVLGFSEDVLNKDAAPDFGLHFSFRY